ncbi:hypothetical protein VP409E501_P0082 [Vibrio phage 409E50-1]|nr:hypothetical protein VP521E561_P0082 [Vibrio phage 521E56-1]CAH9013278.1 hypothetical protein VP384E501_P0082 [Vibrio phage 384E50-1]CAH9013287.1 hypothetical protein VP409E501_P0082 [Vibrio phage 409E50-1]CAH9013303.1 hypothetical protein VP402E501_P0082 [Vibrio phage 402E50-1]CAH9013925.1 hypothetical protein VP405E501_P0082 [Vibrio phage 405E50-1]CAH9013989.1 hypothetical protein VP413E501_P0082 [Vibrio phage 413E50-1]
MFTADFIYKGLKGRGLIEVKSIGYSKDSGDIWVFSACSGEVSDFGVMYTIPYISGADPMEAAYSHLVASGDFSNIS